MIPDKFTLKTFHSDSNFPKHNLDVWVNTTYHSQFKQLIGVGDNAPLYVKVNSLEVLNKYTFYAILQSLNQAEATDHTAYISKDAKGDDWYFEDNADIHIEPVDYKEFPVAEVITIQLNPEEVELWSEDEVNAAKGYVSVHNQVVFLSQKLWIKPGTKHPTLAKVINIIPTNKKTPTPPYQFTHETKIVFEGLPKVQQQVIDFSKIGGLDEIITKLREIIQIPLQYPHILEKFGIRPPKGLLLYGPPGNGKTLIARAVSHNMGAKFIAIEGPELLSKYVGVAENQIREKFEEAEVLGNTVIFIDEIDSIASSRDKSDAEHQISIVATLLNLMDGIRSRSRIFVIGATNRLHSVDPALRRPGRFELEFEVPVPNLDARYDILTKYVNINDTNIVDTSVNAHFLKVLSELTNGYSGADISSLYREAAMNSIRKVLTIDPKTGKMFLEQEPEDIKLTTDDFLVAVKSITPTSLRGVEAQELSAKWEDIVGLAAQKQRLLDLHSFLSKQIEIDAFHHRPDSLNLIFEGSIGAGRKTLIRAFASKFNYELLFVDMLNLFTLGEREAFFAIDEIFLKAKQVAPSIIYIQNLQYIEKKKLYVHKILNATKQFSIRHKVLLIAEINTTEERPDNLIGYRAFKEILSFGGELTENELRPIYDKYQDSEINFEELKRTCKEKTIGQVISEMEERLFLQQ